MKHKFWGLVAIVFVLFFITQDPTGAAATASGIGDGLANAATAVGKFLTALAAGGGQ